MDTITLTHSERTLTVSLEKDLTAAFPRLTVSSLQPHKLSALKENIKETASGLKGLHVKISGTLNYDNIEYANLYALVDINKNRPWVRYYGYPVVNGKVLEKTRVVLPVPRPQAIQVLPAELTAYLKLFFTENFSRIKQEAAQTALNQLDNILSTAQNTLTVAQEGGVQEVILPEKKQDKPLSAKQAGLTKKKAA